LILEHAADQRLRILDAFRLGDRQPRLDIGILSSSGELLHVIESERFESNPFVLQDHR
jgi:hypothetical protein